MWASITYYVITVICSFRKRSEFQDDDDATLSPTHVHVAEVDTVSEDTAIQPVNPDQKVKASTGPPLKKIIKLRRR